MAVSAKELQKLAYLEKITSQETIAKVALTEPDFLVRLRAVNMLTDEDALLKIAINDEFNRIGLEALSKITNESYLHEICKSARFPEVRAEAAKKVTDESFLGEMALNDGDVVTRWLVVELIKNKTVLVNIASKTDDEDLAYIIVNRLSKENLAKVETDNWFITEVVKDLLSR